MKKAIAIISVISVLAILLLILGRKNDLSSTERSLLKNCKVDRTKTDLDEKSIEKVESLASCVIKWENRENEEKLPLESDYLWEHVVISMLSYPNDVKFLNDTCNICGNKSLVELFFRSPSTTWERWCGTAGSMTICTECKRQIQYVATVIN